MKKLLVLLCSLFLLNSPYVYADDFSDFMIEGISIGDSLLDYMTEDEILEEIERNKNDYSHLKESNKYIEIYFFKEFPPYDRISVFIKNNSLNKYLSNSNAKFKILSTFGSIYFINDIGNCRVKKQEIMDVVSEMFPDKKIQESTIPHRGDPSGDSRLEAFAIFFPSGSSIQVGCTDFEETYRIKSNQTEGLNVSIISEEILNWFNNE